MAQRFGFGKLTGINLDGEKAAPCPVAIGSAPIMIRLAHGETIITAIGQGYLLATPLQLAVMTAALANGGKLFKPRITKANDAVEPVAELGLKPENMAVVQRGMYRSVNRPDGTAYASSLLIDGARMSGKTGTVQVRRISKDERLNGVIPNSKLDWHLRDHSLFVGYVPHNNPRFAVSVVIEHGGGGAQVAAPIARDIMVQLMNNKNITAAPKLVMQKSEGQVMSYQARSGRMGQLVSIGMLNMPLIIITLILGLIGVMVLYSVAGGDFSPWAWRHATDWRSV